MGSSGENESGGFFSKSNVAVVGIVVLLLACGWYGFTRYRESSGASVRDRILQEREALNPKKKDYAKKKGDPKKGAQDFYSKLDKLNLTAEQQAKLDATRKLPLDDAGWTQRKKVLGETLTPEQQGELKQLFAGDKAKQQGKTGAGRPGGKDEWLSNMTEADQRAIRARREVWEAEYERERTAGKK